MLSTSFAFRRAVAEGRHLDTRIALTLADGTSHELAGADLAMGGLSCSGSSSQAGTFGIGAAVVGTAEVTLINYDQRWDTTDFTDALLVVSVGATYADGTTEWLRKGTYTCEQPEAYGSTIGITCYDNMSKFQQPYAPVGTIYPATLRTIVTDICAACGVQMLQASFPRDTQTVATRPDDDGVSCLDVLSWAAQMAGCFADVDPWGRLRVRWYETSAFETEDWRDGGTYDVAVTPYGDGDAADGGGFMAGGAAIDGGGFSAPRWATVTAIRSLTVVTDDVVITGVNVTASAEVNDDGTQGAEGESFLYGQDGYVISVQDNPLIQHGCAQSVAQAIGAAVVGMRFRPLRVTSMGDPAIEPGDPVLVVDRYQRTYRAWATSLTWKSGGIQSIDCDAETPARNRAEGLSAATRAIVQQRNRIRAEMSARERAIRGLAQQLEGASGLYRTEQEQQDGSVIIYLHDKPTLAESQILWKMTATAIGISTDGGETYPYGLDVSGQAILDRIYAIGIDAQYVNTGCVALDGNGYIDFNQKSFALGDLSTIGGRSATNVLASIDATVTDVDVEYAESQSNQNPPDTGWSTSSPQWRDGYYIWQRTKTTTGTGQHARTTYSAATCISGRDGVGVASTSIKYGLSDSASTQPSSSAWQDSVPSAIPAGKWLWTKTTYAYTDGSSKTVYMKSYVGMDGTSVSVSKIEYGTSASAATEPSTYSQAAPTSITSGSWLWTKTTYSDGATAVTKSYVGRNGQNGTGIASHSVYYGVSDSASSQPPSSSWSQTAPTSIASGKWLWTKTVIAYTDGTDSTSYSKAYVGTNGRNGQDGTSVTILGSYDTLAELRAAHPTGGTGDAYIVDGDLYVWDGSAWQNVGQIQGPPGQDGQDGTSVSIERIEYGTSSSASATPTNYGTTPPELAQGTWLWVRTTYSDGGTATTKSYVGTDGRDGDSVTIVSTSKTGGVTTITLRDGNSTRAIEIADGEDGEGIPGRDGESSYVHIAWATSSDGVGGFSTTDSVGKTYLGVYKSADEADSQSPGDYSWSLIKGSDGTSPYAYVLTCSPASLVRDAGGAISPSSITFSAARSQGTSAPTAYAGRFVIAEHDGSAWSTKYTSSGNESSKSYSPTSTARLVRCTLYLAGGTTTQLDVQTVPIAADGADAYTVMLTNESHTFPAGATAALNSTATCNVIAYKGSTRVAATIGSIGGKPAGMSTSITGNGTSSASFSVSVTTALTTQGGVLTVPVTVDGRTFDRRFSWALALTGTPGSDGVGIESIVPQYLLTSSDSDVPDPDDSGWSDVEPTWQSGYYIWCRSYITWDTDPVTTTTTTPILASALNDLGERSEANASGITELQGDVSTLSGSIETERDERIAETDDISKYVYNLEGDLAAREEDLRELIRRAAKGATDYIKYEDGELTLGATDSAIRNVMTNSRQIFRTDSGAIAWFGLNDFAIWELFIQTATIRDRLSFGSFSWIARQNGNMTLKWTGD